jgi:glycosyltransferase involved in cell wall biosynthesis
VLVPGPWMKEMWRPYWDDPVAVWPVGIDTERWRPADPAAKSIDVLLYDKVMWERDRCQAALIEPIRQTLREAGRSVREICYGSYREEEFRTALAQCRTMIFLCEHETQGIAYQQALSCGVPILAWDRGGYWLDPGYFPDKISFAPVSSVPYWDERCGLKFAAFHSFAEAWGRFWETARAGGFGPRDYILENLTLEKAAEDYVRHYRGVAD